MPRCDKCAITDLTGKKIGKLTVLEPTERRQNGHVVWLCQCECGNTIEVSGHHLTDKKGPVKSCGCLNSSGEFYTKEVLNDMGLSYNCHYYFDDLRSDRGRVLYFDFAVFQNEQIIALIEYDGEQHFRTDNNGWNTPENFEALRNNDIKKNQYCQNHNLKLIRIPYYIGNINNIKTYIKNKIEEGLYGNIIL